MGWEARFLAASSTALILAVALTALTVAVGAEASTVVTVLVALWVPLLLIALSIAGLGALGGLMDRPKTYGTGTDPFPHAHTGNRFCVHCGVKLA